VFGVKKAHYSENGHVQGLERSKKKQPMFREKDIEKARITIA